jgi:hypothetical protein
MLNKWELILRQIQKGSASTRSNDTKSLKSAVLDWITPRGQPLNPPLARNIKVDRGFHHERTGALLCPADLDWLSTEYVCLVSPSTSSNILQDQGEAAQWRDGNFW